MATGHAIPLAMLPKQQGETGLFLNSEWVTPLLGPLLPIDCIVNNDVRGYLLVKAEAAVGGGRRPACTRNSSEHTMGHQAQRAACAAVRPAVFGQHDQWEGRALPTRKSKEPETFREKIPKVSELRCQKAAYIKYFSNPLRR